MNVDRLRTTIGAADFVPDFRVLAILRRLALDGAPMEEDVASIALGDKAKVLVFLIPLHHAGPEARSGIDVLPALGAARGGLRFESQLLLQALLLNPVDESVSAVLAGQQLVT